MRVPSQEGASDGDIQARLKLFDEATERQRRRAPAKNEGTSQNRGWTRKGLYRQARSRRSV